MIKRSAIKIWCYLLLLGFSITETTVQAADFYISPSGNDTNAGTEDNPFATLPRARDAVRQLKTTVVDRDIKVLIRGGNYYLDETVVFTVEDSAPDEHRIHYMAYPGEAPVFTSGVCITGWEKADNLPAVLPARARDQLWEAPIPEELGSFYTLYQGETKLPRARSKGFRPTTKRGNGYRDGHKDTLDYPSGEIIRGPNLKAWELVVITAAPWTMNVLPVKYLNEKTSVLATEVPAWYSLYPPRLEGFPETAWIENAFYALDEPGEWVYVEKERKLYLWPRNGKPSSDIKVPKLTELIRVEGNIDYDGPKDEPVKGLVFRGLTLTHAERYTVEKDRIGLTLQHEWEMFDKPTAMLRLRGAEDCSIEQCKFTNSGAAGIRIDLHGKNNHIVRNTINDIGGAGVLLAGYGPGTKDVNRGNRVEGNDIYSIGEIYWHSPGIMLWQSGENRIANNRIHDLPYAGIVISGRISWNRQGTGECSKTIRWDEVDQIFESAIPGKRPTWHDRAPFLHARNNLIVRNEIYNVVQSLSDGNGIYVSGAGAGNVIRENYVHDCPSELIYQAIRCDDDQHETIIDRNIISKIGGWSEGILIKGRSDITGNIIALPLNPPKRGMLVLVPDQSGSTDRSKVQGNVFYSNRAEDVIFQEQLNNYGYRGKLERCDADYNVYYNTNDSKWGESHLKDMQAQGVEKNSAIADPKFRNPEKGDFSLGHFSPIEKTQSVPVNMDEIGLR